MDDLRAEGMMRHWGASVENVEEALIALKADGCATLQIIFNLFRQDYITEVFPEAQKRNVGIIVRLPLASGLLSGKWNKDTKFASTDHRNFNANGEKFNVGETFSGLPFEKGVAFAEQLKQMVPSYPAEPVRAALDPRPAGGVDDHRRRDAPGPAEGQCRRTKREPVEPDLAEKLTGWYQERCGRRSAAGFRLRPAVLSMKQCGKRTPTPVPSPQGGGRPEH